MPRSDLGDVQNYVDMGEETRLSSENNGSGTPLDRTIDKIGMGASPCVPLRGGFDEFV